jgi:hypothetical protein
MTVADEGKRIYGMYYKVENFCEENPTKIILFFRVKTTTNKIKQLTSGTEFYTLEPALKPTSKILHTPQNM